VQRALHISSLRSVTVPFRIKICGITNCQDAQQAALLGAGALGLNFYTGSPRYVDPETAANIVGGLPASVECVGVFVNERQECPVQIAHRVGRIGTIQLHGPQAELGPAPPFRVMPAFSVRDRHDLGSIRQLLERTGQDGWLPDAILIDAHVEGQFGGTGVTVPWEILADFRLQVPLILAGGLTPENVAEAIRIVGPDGVDVASGVEMRPGIKDREKMQDFIDNARAAFAKLRRTN
jgi:phosphoribosylanthranilate isomerase